MEFNFKSAVHHANMARELSVDKHSTDVFYVTTEKVFHAHLSLLLPHIPVLASLVCQGCLDSHSKVVTFIPGIQQQVFSTALEEFYLGDQTDRLEKNN